MIDKLRTMARRTTHTAKVLGAAALSVLHILGETARTLTPLALLAAVVIAPEAITAVAVALVPPTVIIAATVLAAATIMAVAALRQPRTTGEDTGLLDTLLTRGTRLLNL